MFDLKVKKALVVDSWNAKCSIKSSNTALVCEAHYSNFKDKVQVSSFDKYLYCTIQTMCKYCVVLRWYFCVGATLCCHPSWLTVTSSPSLWHIYARTPHCLGWIHAENTWPPPSRIPPTSISIPTCTYTSTHTHQHLSPCSPVLPRQLFLQGFPLLHPVC